MLTERVLLAVKLASVPCFRPYLRHFPTVHPCGPQATEVARCRAASDQYLFCTMNFSAPSNAFSSVRQQKCRRYAHCEQQFISVPCFRPHFQCYTSNRHQPLEINAVNKTMNSWAMGVAAATASFGLLVGTASAQLAPAPAAPKAPVAAPAAPKTAPAAPAAAKAKVEKKAPSACAKLDEAACNAKAECSYTKPTKANVKTGKVQAPYCHLAKKTAAPKGSAAPSAAPAPAAPKAPAATAPAPKAPGVPKPQ